MHCTRQITDDLYYVGASDRRLNMFENLYPVPKGISYNSYLIKDEKTVLLDTSDHAVADLFFENLASALGSRALGLPDCTAYGTGPRRAYENRCCGGIPG